MTVHVLLINGTVNQMRWTAHKYGQSLSSKAKGVDTAKLLQGNKLLLLRGAKVTLSICKHS